MRQPSGTQSGRSEIGWNSLRHKALSSLEYWRRPEKMDLTTLKEQAERCRRLAKHADPFTQKRLLDLAAEYDARIVQLEPKPSAATRRLRDGKT